MVAAVRLQPLSELSLHQHLIDTSVIMAQSILEELAKQSTQKRPAAASASSGSSSVDGILTSMARLHLSHESELRALTQAHSFRIMIHSTTLKQALTTIKEAHAKQAEALKGEKAAAGASQRSAIHSALLVHISGLVTARSGEAASLAERVAKLGPEELDRGITRLRPAHRTFIDGKPWSWDLMLTQSVEGVLLTQFAGLACYNPLPASPRRMARPKLWNLAYPPLTQGPLARQVREFVETKETKKKKRTG